MNNKERLSLEKLIREMDDKSERLQAYMEMLWPKNSQVNVRLSAKQKNLSSATVLSVNPHEQRVVVRLNKAKIRLGTKMDHGSVKRVFWKDVHNER